MSDAMKSDDAEFFIPTADDPVYRRERVCIEAAIQETLRCGFRLFPTFAPAPSLLDKVLRRSDRRHDLYEIPRARTIDALWRRYRPLPWSGADNAEILKLWIRVLYSLSEVRSTEIAAIISGEFDPDPKPPMEWSLDTPCILNRERWQCVADDLGGMLPPYG